MDNPVMSSEANQLLINCTCSKIQTLPLMTFLNKIICTLFTCRNVFEFILVLNNN